MVSAAAIASIFASASVLPCSMVISGAISSLRSRMQVGGLAHDLRSARRRHLAPGREALGGGLERLVEVGLLGMGEGADHLFGGGVEHLEHLARLGRPPFAGNE